MKEKVNLLLLGHIFGWIFEQIREFPNVFQDVLPSYPDDVYK